MYEDVGKVGWRSCSVYDLAIWKNGLAFKNIDFSDSGRPVIKIAELKNGVTEQTARTSAEYDPSVFVQAGDILFSWSGNPDTSIDVFRWEGEDGWLNQHIFKVTPRAGVSDDFLFFVLKWMKPRFAEIARNKQTTGLGHVTIQDLKRMMVGVPEPEDQNSITGIVGTLQRKINLNRHINKTLEAIARAIFKDWFVDFGPTRAKQEGRKPYLAPDIWALFPDRLDEEGRPNGWVAGTLQDVAILNGETWGARNHPEYVRYVDLSNAKWGYIDAIEVFEWSTAPSRARRVLRPGDTIVGTVRPGNGSYAFISEGGLTGSTGFAVLRPKMSHDREFIWCAATDAKNIDRLSRLADGGAYPAVRPELVAETEVVLAETGVRTTFARICAPLLDRIEGNKREVRVLAALCDLLLPKLMSGEIRIRDVAPIHADSEVPNASSINRPSGANDNFKDAILVSALVRGLSDEQHPLGNLRLQKAAYFVHRKAEHNTERLFKRHAAGPYNPDMKYRGGLGIAKRNGYVKDHRSSNYTGLVVADAIDKIDLYLERYDFSGALNWVLQSFRYKKNEELELLATVDYASQSLRRDGLAVNVGSVISYIEADQKWKPKLKREIFSRSNIESALKELDKLFPDEGGA